MACQPRLCGGCGDACLGDDREASYRKHVGLLLLTVFPVLATVLLTGGGFGLSTTTVGIYTILGLVAITFGRLGKLGRITGPLADLAQIAGVAGWVLILLAAILVVVGVDFNLPTVDTRDWGGLLITLVVAITGIVASLPLGIVLALGRRSEMPGCSFSVDGIYRILARCAVDNSVVHGIGHVAPFHA